MDFKLTEEQVATRDLARRIFEEKVDNDYLRNVEESGYRYDAKLWQALTKAGLTSVALPENLGGSNYGFETLCLVIEEAARTLAPVPAIPTLVGATLAICHYGNKEQRQQWLGDFNKGNTILSVALSEPANYDPCMPLLQAVKKGKDWCLNGVKSYVPFADISQAVVVSAATPSGHGLFVMPSKIDGCTLRRLQVSATEPQFLMSLNNVTLPATALLCEGSATDDSPVDWLVQRMLVAYCIMAMGVTEKMTTLTASYINEREQFSTKIGAFQAVRHRAANCYIDTMCLRACTEQAVSLLDAGKDAYQEVRMAKIWAGDVAHRVSYASQHMHGGTGVDRDYPLFRYCLWAKYVELTLMSSAFCTAQLGTAIARRAMAKV